MNNSQIASYLKTVYTKDPFNAYGFIQIHLNCKLSQKNILNSLSYSDCSYPLFSKMERVNSIYQFTVLDELSKLNCIIEIKKDFVLSDYLDHNSISTIINLANTQNPFLLLFQNTGDHSSQIIILLHECVFNSISLDFIISSLLEEPSKGEKNSNASVNIQSLLSENTQSIFDRICKNICLTTTHLNLNSIHPYAKTLPIAFYQQLNKRDKLTFSSFHDNLISPTHRVISFSNDPSVDEIEKKLLNNHDIQEEICTEKPQDLLFYFFDLTQVKHQKYFTLNRIELPPLKMDKQAIALCVSENSIIYQFIPDTTFKNSYLGNYVNEWLYNNYDVDLQQPFPSIQNSTPKWDEKISKLLQGKKHPIGIENINAIIETILTKETNLIAIKEETRKVSYGQLCNAVIDIMDIIKSTKWESKYIALLFDRSIEFNASMLAVLLSGKTFVPINKNWPTKRIQRIINDHDIKVILTDDNYPNSFDNSIIFEVNTIIKKAINSSTLMEWNKKLNSRSAKDICYILFTSGSTGNPKGVMINDYNVLNLNNWFNDTFKVSGSKVLNLAQITFDVVIEETLITLLNQGCICIPDNKTIQDRSRFHSYLEKEQINIAQFVPATLEEYLLDFPKLSAMKTVICGGESLPEKIKNNILNKGYHLYNNYGPTETTVDAVFCDCTKSKHNKMNVIGNPIYNTQLQIVDTSDRQVMPFQFGELLIGGFGVSDGYLNNLEASKSAFMKINGHRYYKTGDIATLSNTGEIIFKGRKDDQIQLRGVRIELNEIIQVMNNAPGVKSSTTIAATIENIEQLVAFYIPSEDSTTDQEQIRIYLQENLTSHMIPAILSKVAYFPLTENGKIDKEVLLEMIQSSKDFSPAESETEKVLEEIWLSYLEFEQISVDAHFLEIGGHSLMAARVVTELNETLNLDFDLFDFLSKGYTIRKLAELVEEALWDQLSEEEQKELLEETGNTDELINPVPVS